jgi:hypothetical protein
LPQLTRFIAPRIIVQPKPALDPLLFKHFGQVLAGRVSKPEHSCSHIASLWTIVDPGNPDLVDTLGVERHPFRPSTFYFRGHSGSSAGLPSHSRRSSD